MKQQRIEKKIPWGDLDSLGIVFYPKYYEWIDQSSHLFFEDLGMNLVELWDNRRLQFCLVKTGCDYFRPGRYHQNIIIETHIEALEAKTMILRHNIMDKEKEKIMVSGMEKRICIKEAGPDKLKACDIPEDLHQILKQNLFIPKL